MKNYAFSLFLINMQLSYGQDCSMPKNGSYQIHYNDTEKIGDTFTVQDSIMNFTRNNEITEYKIIKFDKCTFRIEPVIPIDESTLNDFQKLMVRQHFYYNIEKTDEDVYYFTTWYGMNIKSFSGKFIRVGD